MSQDDSRLPTTIPIAMPAGPQPMLEIRTVKRFLRSSQTYARWWDSHFNMLDLREGRDFVLVHRGRVLPKYSKFRRDAERLVTLDAAKRIAGADEDRGSILSNWLEACAAGERNPASDLVSRLDVLEALRDSPDGFSVSTAARLLQIPPRALCGRLRASKWLLGSYGVRRVINSTIIARGLLSQPMRIRSLAGDVETASPSTRITLRGLYVLRTGRDAGLT